VWQSSLGIDLQTYCALEVWIYFLNDMHPQTTAPLHAALLQE